MSEYGELMDNEQGGREYEQHLADMETEQQVNGYEEEEE